MYAKLKPSVIEAILCGKTEGGAAAGLLDSFLQAKNGMGISLVFCGLQFKHRQNGIYDRNDWDL